MEQGGWLAVATVLGAAVTAGGTWAIKILQARAQIRSADADHIGGQWQTLLTTLQGEIAGLRQRITLLEARVVELTADHHECQLNHARALDRIEELTAILVERKIPFRPWTAGPDLGGPKSGPVKQLGSQSSPDVGV